MVSTKNYMVKKILKSYDNFSLLDAIRDNIKTIILTHYTNNNNIKLRLTKKNITLNEFITELQEYQQEYGNHIIIDLIFKEF